MARTKVTSTQKDAQRDDGDTYTDNVSTSPQTTMAGALEQSGRSGRTTPAAEQQYERIQKIAAQLFASSGYRAVGVAEIGDAVGLGRGALYYHISSKEELLFSIVVRYIEELVISGREALENEPDPRKRIHLLSRLLMQCIFTNLPEMTVCFREADCLTGQRHRIVSDLHKAYQDIWSETLREGEKKGIFRPLPSIAIKGILGMYFYSFLWLKPGGKQSANDIADIFAKMALSIAEAKDSI
ncbi:MAG TPA: TetR/AcrR family transcriptional regulator [Hyphomicrobium sp.]|nr:TetR/AcrR family transcriptional regulator [Hyphomicrobium sp.]